MRSRSVMLIILAGVLSHSQRKRGPLLLVFLSETWHCGVALTIKANVFTEPPSQARASPSAKYPPNPNLSMTSLFLSTKPAPATGPPSKRKPTSATTT